MIRIAATVPAATATVAGIPRRRLVQEEEVKKQQHRRRSRSSPPARRPCLPGSEHVSSSRTPTSPPPSPTWALAPGVGGRVGAFLSLCTLRSVTLLLNGFLLLLLLPFRRRTVVASSSLPAVIEGRMEKRKRKKGMVVRLPAAMVGRRARDKEAAGRRALAIKRVREAIQVEEEESGGEATRSWREYATFRTARGDALFTQSWAPVAVPNRGLVVLLHGLNEHSERYNHFAKQLNGAGFKVHGMDWIGHGGSDGLHGYVHSLDYAVNDLKMFLQKVLLDSPGLPCFIFGHSTGAAIILKAVMDPKVETHVKGVVLTSPAVCVQPPHPIITAAAPILAFLAPTYQFSAACQNDPPVSRDLEALKIKYADPLVFTGSIRVRTGYEILKITSYLQQNLKRVTVPFLVLHGTADTLTDPEGTKRLYTCASSNDKSIKLYEGFLHDLLFEPERDEISKDIIHWLSSRIMNKKGTS